MSLEVCLLNRDNHLSNVVFQCGGNGVEFSISLAAQPSYYAICGTAGIPVRTMLKGGASRMYTRGEARPDNPKACCGGGRASRLLERVVP
jgi:hypothetical protein